MDASASVIRDRAARDRRGGVTAVDPSAQVFSAVLGDRAVRDRRGGAVEAADPSTIAGVAITNRESIKDCFFRLTVYKSHHRPNEASIDGRHIGSGLTLNGDRLAPEIDGLHVDAGGNQDEIPVHGSVDPGLDRRLIRRDVDRVGEGWGNGKGRDQKKGSGNNSDTISHFLLHSLCICELCKFAYIK